jgi:hypothetical protein
LTVVEATGSGLIELRIGLWIKKIEPGVIVCAMVGLL